MTFALWLVLLASAAAAVTDLRTRRIPNAISLALASAGVIVSAQSGWHGVGTFAAIGIVAIVAGTPLFSLRLLGGGDVKLLAAACATLGLAQLPAFLAGTLLCGGLVGIATAIYYKRLAATLANVRAMALPAMTGMGLTPISGGIKMPYGIAIFGGALVAAAVHYARLRPLL